MICPICLKEKREFEHHHVIWRMDKGSDDPVNLLDICKTCHAILTHGESEDRVPRDMACFAHQMAKYGLTFLLKSGTIFSAESEFGQGFAEKWGNASAEMVDEALKFTGSEMYKKYTENIKAIS